MWSEAVFSSAIGQFLSAQQSPYAVLDSAPLFEQEESDLSLADYDGGENKRISVTL